MVLDERSTFIHLTENYRGFFKWFTRSDSYLLYRFNKRS